ncbi:MAG: ComEC/Rec2 family competence protein, partial [Sedimentisphaerales bacterium]|nr:ComEC/Rec2 family competence protein [Sedimentisphaerales bacterium]
MEGIARLGLVPLMTPALAFALGIAAGRSLAQLNLWLIGSLIMLSAASILALTQKHRRLTALAITLTCFSLGGFRFIMANSYLPDNHIIRYCQSQSDTFITLTGTVITQPRLITRPGAMARFDFRSSETFCFDLKAKNIIANSTPAHTTGIVRVYTKFTPDFTIGQSLSISGLIYPRTKADSQPGGKLRRDKIFTAMTIEQPAMARIISEDKALSFNCALYHIRQKLLAVFLRADNTEPDNISQTDPVLAALLLGSYQGISPATRDQFLASGTMHYLSLSGLHVATITGFLWLALNLFNLPRWLQGTLPALFVIAYLLIVPARPPILRAGILSLAFSLAYISRRNISPVNILALCLLIILICRPLDLFDIGLQLSFTIVLGIIIVSPTIITAVLANPNHIILRDPTELTLLDIRPLPLRIYSSGKRWLLYALAVSSVAWLISMPLIASQFNRISWLAALNSIILAIPVTCALFTGILRLILAAMPFNLQFLNPILNYPTDIMLQLVELQAGIPASCENVKCLHPALNYIYAGLIIAILTFAFVRNLYCLKYSLTLLFLTLSAIIINIHLSPNVKQMTIHALPVGHGCCIVIESPGINPLIYDCGSNDDFNLANNTVIPFLRARGINSISALFISHADIDHYNGVPDLISAIPAQGLYLPGGFYDHATKSDDYFFNLPIIRQTRKHYLSSGNLLSAGELHIETLWPQPGIQLP